MTRFPKLWAEVLPIAAVALALVTMAPARAQAGEPAAADRPFVVGLLAPSELGDVRGLAPAAPYALAAPERLGARDELSPLCGQKLGAVRAGVQADLNGTGVSGFQSVAQVRNGESLLSRARRAARACKDPYALGGLTIVPAPTQPQLSEAKNSVALAGTIQSSGNMVAQIVTRAGARLVSELVVVVPPQVTTLDAGDLSRLAQGAQRHLDAVNRALNPPRPRRLSRRALTRQDYKAVLPNAADLGLSAPLAVESVDNPRQLTQAGVESTLWGTPLPGYKQFAAGAVAADGADPTQFTQLLVGMPGDQAAKTIDAAEEATARREPFQDATGATITPVDAPPAVTQAAPEDAVVAAAQVERPGEPATTAVRVLYRNGQFIGDVSSTDTLAPVATSLSVAAADVLAQRAEVDRLLSPLDVIGRAEAAVYAGSGQFQFCAGPAGNCGVVVTTQSPQVTVRLERDGSATATFPAKDTDATIDPSCTSATLGGEGEVVLQAQTVSGGYLRGQFVGSYDQTKASGTHFFVGQSSGSCGWEFHANLTFTAYRV